MGLNKTKGNMYDFITHTWNTIKGECYHDCSYCYMKRWGKLNPVRFDDKELKTNLGSKNIIFVGSSCDMFSKNISEYWIDKTIKYCEQFENKYLIQTKNPYRLKQNYSLGDKFVVCTTIETNRYLPDIMRLSHNPTNRAYSISEIKNKF
jgi:DNA repair photolyase